jgi:hypothetical protein
MWHDFSVPRHRIANLTDQHCLKYMFYNPLNDGFLDQVFRYWAMGKTRPCRAIVEERAQIRLIRGEIEALAQSILDRPVNTHIWIDSLKMKRAQFPKARLIDRKITLQEGVNSWWYLEPWIPPPPCWVAVFGPQGQQTYIGNKQGPAHKAYTINQFSDFPAIFKLVADDFGLKVSDATRRSY